MLNSNLPVVSIPTTRIGYRLFNKLMSSVLFQLVHVDLESNKALLQEGFKILNSAKAVTAEHFESTLLESFFDYLNDLTQSNYGEACTVEICEFFIENDFPGQLVRLNEYFGGVCETLTDDCETESEYRKGRVFLASHAVSNFLLGYSNKFRLKYLETGGLKYHMKLLSSEVFYTNWSNHEIFQRIVRNTFLLSTSSEMNKQEWTELNAVEILLGIARKASRSKIDAYSAALEVINDEQIKNLAEAELSEIIALYTRPLNVVTKVFETDSNLKRDKMQFQSDENDISKEYEVYCVPDQDDANKRKAVTGILNSIYKLAVNDKIKYDLYVKYKVKDGLRVIIFKGSDIEQKFAFKLLTQLCFDLLVLDSVSRDIELLECIKAVANGDTSKALKSTINYAKQIKWSLNPKENGAAAVKHESISAEKVQVMISYNSASRDLCIKIKNELETAGYKIWIDVNEIHGSSLESMANAVENSEIILMCVTEGYRQSINCQAEAQFAFKLKKPIIPLIMQKGYDNVGGWLGMIIGDKIFINFMKHSFEDAFNKLHAQLSLIKPMSPVKMLAAKTEGVNLQAKVKKLVEDWSEEEVQQWFQKNSNMAIYEHLKPCDGKLLNQVFKMKNNAPEFYYQFISIKNTMPSRDVLVFTENIERLFSNDK